MIQRMAWMGTVGLAALLAVACGDDSDGGDGGDACAHAEMVCMDDPSVSIDCGMFDSAPADLRSCVSDAADCDGVTACLFGAADEGAAGAAAD